MISPRTVTHPRTNRDRRRTTTLINATVLPVTTKPNCHHHNIIIITCVKKHPYAPKPGDRGTCPPIICLGNGDTIYVIFPSIFCHRTNNLWTFSVIIKANYACVAFQIWQYFPTIVVWLSVKKLIQKQLNISASTQQNGLILWTIYRTNTVFPRMHALAYKISEIFWGNTLGPPL